MSAQSFDSDAYYRALDRYEEWSRLTWEPIATAPTDGTLVYVGDGKVRDWFPPLGRYHDGVWTDEWFATMLIQPTHWMTPKPVSPS